MKLLTAFLAASLACGAAFGADEVVCGKKTHCSHMKDCEEAMAYLKKCPGQVKMDGDGDGIPCEKQHCGHLKKQHSFFDADRFKNPQSSKDS